MNIFLLDGKDMTSSETAYRIIEETLGFPEWFGHNLDALYDCLSDLDAEETAIVFVNTDTLTENIGQYANKMLSCFRDVSEEYGMIWIEKE